MTVYAPPVTLTPLIVSLATDIGAACARLEIQHEHTLKLRRINRIRTIQGSLAIEGNTLSEEQITAIVAGKRVIAPPEDILEAQNAIACYRELLNWQPAQELHLKAAHQLLMKWAARRCGQISPGHCRSNEWINSDTHGAASREGAAPDETTAQLAKKYDDATVDCQLCLPL